MFGFFTNVAPDVAPVELWLTCPHVSIQLYTEIGKDFENLYTRHERTRFSKQPDKHSIFTLIES